MNHESGHSGLERCWAFINCQLQPGHRPAFEPQNGLHWRAVTISRQAGCGALAIAEELARILDVRAGKKLYPWAVFDRNLVEKVLQDHHLPGRLAAFMPEDRVSIIQDTLEDLFGLHPPSELLVQKTTETILHLAELGGVILIGRGANIITNQLNGVFNVRLVGSFERRIESIQKSRQLGKKAALAFIRKEDLGRRRYVKKYFKKDIDDPLLYHLTINTDLLSHERAAMLLADIVAPEPIGREIAFNHEDSRKT
jgi:cytidylate kinase